MKKLTIVAWLLYCGFLCAEGEDQPVLFEDPSGNLVRLSPTERDQAISEDLWLSYQLSLKNLTRKIDVAPEFRNNEEVAKSIVINKYTMVLKTMLELRAFTAQHKTINIPSDRVLTIGKIDAILERLNLYYEPHQEHALFAFVSYFGIDKLREALLPLTNP